MKKAFTLAEVLITLGIIGVVAALTIPSLIQKHREQVAVAKVKKAYSTISQAYLMAIAENGTVDNWGLKKSEQGEDGIRPDESAESEMKFLNILTKYMKHQTFNKKSVKNKGLLDFALVDGTKIVGVWLDDPENCNGSKDASFYCGDFYITIDDKPYKDDNNKWQPNSFVFLVNPNRIMPMGSGSDFWWCKSGENYSRCSAWVITNGNMDYLHCPDDLSWNGQTKCK